MTAIHTLGSLTTVPALDHLELVGEPVASLLRTWEHAQHVGVVPIDPGHSETSATVEVIRENQHVLTPGRYVASEAREDDGEPVGEKIARLTKAICDNFAESADLQDKVLAALDSLQLADDA